MFRWLMVCAAIALTLTASAASQDPTFAIRVNVPVVSVEAVVLDSNGRPVTTLNREDFKVFEDGEPRPLQNFSSVESPYSILLLFQNTPNISSQRPFMAEASNRFLDTLRSQDRVSIYTMEVTLRRNLDWRLAQSGKPQNVSVGRPGGLLNLYEAIDDAFGKFGNIAGRKGMVVLTNGRDDQLFQETRQKGRVRGADEDGTFQKILKKVRERGIPLYMVAVDTDMNLMASQSTPPATTPETIFRGGAAGAIVLFAGAAIDEYVYLRNLPNYANFQKIKDPSPSVADDFLIEVRSRMEQLSEASGGRIYFPKHLDEVAPLYEQIGRELGTSYSLGYPPGSSARSGTHRIEVRVSDPKLRVIQSRQSYTVR